MEALLPTWLIWFILGFVFVFLELFLPGFILLFFAIGCLVTTLIVLIWDLNLALQILIFTGVSVTSLLLLRNWMMQTFRGASDSLHEQDFDDFPEGEHVQVLKTITPDKNGRIMYRGSTWEAAAEEIIESGETVEIVTYLGDSRQKYFVRKLNKK